MKRNYIFLLITLLFISCAREEDKKLEVYNTEAFAFQVDGGWEVNASARVKGFQQNTDGKTYSGKLSYSVGIITPANDTIKNIAADELSESQAEEISDLPLEAQLELDSTYEAGKYQLIFNVKDELSGVSAAAQKEVDLQ